MKKPKWDKQVLRLQPNHTWRCQPGYKVFVAGRGDVRFDVPQDWVFEPGKSSFCFFDRSPPDDDCRLEASSRACLARGANIQPLITLDYWLDDAQRVEPVWDEVLRTLQLGQYVKDPTRGRVVN